MEYSWTGQVHVHRERSCRDTVALITAADAALSHSSGAAAVAAAVPL